MKRSLGPSSELLLGPGRTPSIVSAFRCTTFCRCTPPPRRPSCQVFCLVVARGRTHAGPVPRAELQPRCSRAPRQGFRIRSDIGTSGPPAPSSPCAGLAHGAHGLLDEARRLEKALLAVVRPLAAGPARPVRHRADRRRHSAVCHVQPSRIHSEATLCDPRPASDAHPAQRRPASRIGSTAAATSQTRPGACPHSHGSRPNPVPASHPRLRRPPPPPKDETCRENGGRCITPLRRRDLCTLFESVEPRVLDIAWSIAVLGCRCCRLAVELPARRVCCLQQTLRAHSGGLSSFSSRVLQPSRRRCTRFPTPLETLPVTVLARPRVWLADVLGGADSGRAAVAHLVSHLHGRFEPPARLQRVPVALNPQSPLEVDDSDRDGVARGDHGGGLARVQQHLAVGRARSRIHTGHQRGGAARDQLEAVAPGSTHAEPVPVQLLR